MASSVCCYTSPMASMSSLSSSSSMTAIRFVAAVPRPKSRIARSSSLSLQIVGAQQQYDGHGKDKRENRQSISSDGNLGLASETLLPAVRSRREIFGLGAMLATMGLGMAVVTPETYAATGECAELTVTPSGLSFCDTEVGSGIPAQKGLLIKAHYSGKLENGTVFDSSYTRGRPLIFHLGLGEVIKGWDQGIVGTKDGIPPMLAGGKRTLRIPAKLGYGERGAGCRQGSCVIPPNSVLIFDVEFLGKAK